ncbi:hypothetical protein TNIN_125201 [Trichonephila inaurata madagascariensis]|uniref:Secreted protein n=1 Tax=Trichonephila inaurata madagascariensis TaxID=2747483 RepID=A0A8X6YW70_9ARAC|nr:hypothetical protein TNIN_125201 [Trichonephila inaurata madagascariensis]
MRSLFISVPFLQLCISFIHRHVTSSEKSACRRARSRSSSRDPTPSQRLEGYHVPCGFISWCSEEASSLAQTFSLQSSLFLGFFPLSLCGQTTGE